MNRALDNQTFGVMLVAGWAMMIPIGPFLAIKSPRQYKHRSIPSVGLETDIEEKMGYVGEQSGHTTWQPPVKDNKDSLLQTLRS